METLNKLGIFNINSNELKSLEGTTKVVKCDFIISHNKLKNLKKIPKITNNINFNQQSIKGKFECQYKELQDLLHCTKIMGNFLTVLTINFLH